MSEPVSSSLTPFVWVSKRDGQLVPFEAATISRALFAASERLGQPDPFMARELTDGILHFLPAEVDGPVPTTAQIADTVVKVVRELGQPALAQAFLDGRQEPTEPEVVEKFGPTRRQCDAWAARGERPEKLAWLVSRACWRDYSLGAVFAPDLRAAHRDGLLRLGGLATPFELAGCVLGPPTAGTLDDVVAETRLLAGETVVLEGAEYALARWAATAEGASESAPSAGGCAAQLRRTLLASGLRAVANLNAGSLPAWADDLADGPLFTEHQPNRGPEAATVRAAALADVLLTAVPESRVDWHLRERDFTPPHRERLLPLAQLALAGSPIAFVFDRSRRPTPLAEGLDRRQPALLLAVGLDLAKLAVQSDVGVDLARYLQKLGSLARLALSAAVQKRDFLRRQPRTRPAFLLDRARLMVVPIGLEGAARTLAGGRLGEFGPALEIAREIVRHLQSSLRRDGGALHLDACLDGAPECTFDDEPAESIPLRPETVAGVTAFDPEATFDDQLRASSSLHGLTECGTAALILQPGHALGAEAFVELLRRAWHQTDVVRLRLHHLSTAQSALADSSPTPLP